MAYIIGVDVGGTFTDTVLLDSDGVHVRSAAALRIVRGLRSPYALLWLGIVLPRPIRDAVYDLVACNRHRWFG